jgi:CHASE3 domain sensor protein
MINIGIENFCIIILFLLIVFFISSIRYSYNNSNNSNNNSNNSNNNSRNDFISQEVIDNVANQANKLTFKTEKLTQLMLFYRTDCVYSQLMLPIWYQVLEQIVDRTNLEIIEQDCTMYTTLCNKYNIETFPSILLLKDNVINHFVGEITLNNLTYFLKSRNIYLKKTINDISVIEPFEDNDSNNVDEQIEETDPRYLMRKTCPIVSFDHYVDGKKTYYQIFNKNGQYGYSIGGNDENLSEYQAAYNTVDTYLSSLPESNSVNMNKCAKLYSQHIREFGLCNSEELEIMNKELRNIEYGKVKLQKGIKKEDYKNKKNVISAIKTACKL